jgi:hypothetical protein
MRECGECTLCCKMAEIFTYESPAGEYCKHCEINVGCKIYKDRPYECSSFKCEWLKGNTPEEFYPKDCGFLVEQIEEELLFLIIEKYENQKQLFKDIEKYTNDLNKKGISILTSTKALKMAHNHTQNDIWNKIYKKRNAYRSI